jgi:DNA-directed RNA polymerase beta subunit
MYGLQEASNKHEKVHQTSMRRYLNGTIDHTLLGPPSASDFPDGEEDKR